MSRSDLVRRRTLLASGVTGAALLAAYPVYLVTRETATAREIAATPSPHVTPSASHPARMTGTPGLHGATITKSAFPHGTTFDQAIKLWESYTGTKIHTFKVYYARNHFPTVIDDRIKALLDNGIKALLCFKPDFLPTSRGNLDRMQATMKAYKKAGLEADVAIWQEPQVNQGHPDAGSFIAAVQYYGPAVRNYYPLVYDASGAAGPTGWVQYYPGDPYVDKVVVDFYGHHYVTGERIDAVAALADNALPPKPFGLWEMGDRSSHVDTPTPSEMTAYFAYIQSFFTNRLEQGKTNADITWYNHGVSAIKSKTDFRIPLWRNLVNATS
ncbi:MAG TPA: hypothetical protein VGS19_33755 [Streptosporangiaceae bacterium]|nr:hypothetical protein [Streptosporangiaceae bacterium]